MVYTEKNTFNAPKVVSDYLPFKRLMDKALLLPRNAHNNNYYFIGIG